MSPLFLFFLLSRIGTNILDIESGRFLGFMCFHFLVFWSVFSLIDAFCFFCFSVQDYGKCPITKEELTMDDVLPVKTNKVLVLILDVS